jgi:hypothetical protein
MSLLLPQTRAGVVQSARPVDIHGDRYVDVAVSLEEDGGTFTGRVSATECPSDLAPGERVSVKFTMGVATRVERARGGNVAASDS